jgi:hypothetical protein
MAHYTVIKPDSTIYKDGNGIFNCDMSGLPEDLHVEYIDGTKPNLTVSSESEIETALGVSLTTLITRYTAAKKTADDANALLTSNN